MKGNISRHRGIWSASQEEATGNAKIQNHSPEHTKKKVTLPLISQQLFGIPSLTPMALIILEKIWARPYLIKVSFSVSLRGCFMRLLLVENGDKLGSRKLSPKLELATILGMDVNNLLPRVGTRTPLKEENIFLWENNTTGVEVCKPVGMWVGRHQDHKRRVIKFSP